MSAQDLLDANGEFVLEHPRYRELFERILLSDTEAPAVTDGGDGGRDDDQEGRP